MVEMLQVQKFKSSPAAQLSSSACAYCSSFLRDDYSPRYPWDIVIERQQGFAIVPTKGALMPGWLLVVGPKHQLSTATLTGSERALFEHGIEVARNLVESKFGPATVFENGPCAKATLVGCGIDHLHVHVAPLEFSLTEAARRTYPENEWLSCSSLEQLSNIHHSGAPYFYVSEPNRPPQFSVPRSRLSQLLRRVIAAEMGKAGLWNYSRHWGASNVARTLKSLSIRTES